MITIAGPCALESQLHTKQVVELLHNKVDYIRGGIVKYRSNKKAYQGNHDAANWIAELKKQYHFKYCVEVFNVYDIGKFYSIADMWQVGSRNMYNVALLKILNNLEKPVLFKRHFAASLNEFIKHAEYLKDCEVWLCLRGQMSLHPEEQRFYPDVMDIQRLKEMTNKKIIYDVSHSSCEKRFIKNAIRVARVLEADGIMVEVHPEPEKALSDSQQQLNFDEFLRLKREGII